MVQNFFHHQGHPFWQHYQVWGQPSAWQDTVITTWLVEDTASHLKERHGTSQCLHRWDCLKAQWSEPVLYASWANQQITLPLMPDATTYLQSPDTHWNSPFKADLRNCKAEAQFQGEVAAKQVIGLDQDTELKADIEKTIQAARPVNHIKGQPYDLDDPEYQKLIRTMLPTVGKTKSQSSGSRN